MKSGSGQSSDNVKIDKSKIGIAKFEIDITEVQCSLAYSLRLLCAGHSILLDRHKGQLKSFFDPKFHYLLKSTNPVICELLGDNVDVKIAKSTKISEAAQKLQVKHTTTHTVFCGNAYRGNASRCPFYKHTFECKQQMSASYRGGINSTARFAPKHGRFQRGHAHNFGNNFIHSQG